MRQERLYILVGLFVGGAICLTLLIALYLYDEYMHEKVETYVMFFNGSLAGLHVNSEVTYRGVKIGEVKIIEITEIVDKNQIKIPVYVQFFVERKFVGKQNPIRLLINKGYVASIKKPNFFTGIASIDLIRNNTPVNLFALNYHGYPVFPTHNQEEEYISLDDAIQAAKQTFQDISNFVKSTRVNKVLETTTKTAASVDIMVTKLNQMLPPTMSTLTRGLKDLTLLVNDLDRVLPPTLNNFSQSLKVINSFTTNLDELLPPAINNFSEGMKKVSEAANSIQNFTDYLARYPESLLRGKK